MLTKTWTLAEGLPGPDVQERLDAVEVELQEVDLQIAELQQKKAELNRRRDALLLHLEEACDSAEPPRPSSSKASRSDPAMSQQELRRFDGTGTVEPRLCGGLPVVS